MIALALLLAGFAVAAPDLTKPPAAFCESAETLLWGAASCNDNVRLSGGAERCLKKLEALEKEVGVEATRIAADGTLSQAGETGTGNQEYTYSERAFTYLNTVSALALVELEPFPAYLLAPDGYYDPKVTGKLDPDVYASRLECHGGNERRIRAVQLAISTKMQRFVARSKEAKSFTHELAGKAADFSTRTPSAASAGKGVSSGLTAAPLHSGSTITGVKEKLR
jgi:hypothetical protein